MLPPPVLAPSGTGSPPAPETKSSRLSPTPQAERLKDYATNRPMSDTMGTSQLSPYLHYGELSVRRVWYQTKQMEWLWVQSRLSIASIAAFQRQLAFREYSRYLSFHFPFTHERALVERFRSFPWRLDEGQFMAWRQGATGYPFVDAGMRQLWATGWLHHRVRRVVASFLVKHLMLPWQWGMKHYWDTLLDADLECDVLGWQYVSGGLPDSDQFEEPDDVEQESRRCGGRPAFAPQGGGAAAFERGLFLSQWSAHPGRPR